MKYILLIILGLYSTFLLADNDNCSIRLYVNDQDALGTNIRKSPNGMVLFSLPQAKETAHYVHATQFKNGWWRLDSVDHEAGVQISIKEGWVHGSVVNTGLDDAEFVDDGNGGLRLITQIYSQPSYKSEKLQFMVRGSKREIIGCSGMWLKIRQTHDAKSAVGWWSPEDQCASAVTNCANGSAGEDSGKDIWGNR